MGVPNTLNYSGSKQKNLSWMWVEKLHESRTIFFPGWLLRECQSLNCVNPIVMGLTSS